MPVARLGLILNLLVPLGLLAYDANTRALGANGLSFAIHTTGVLAVGCLLASLLVSPLRQMTGWSWLVQFRRSLGVFAFYYACAHLFIYFWWDRSGDISSTFYEITHRFYLGIGFASLAIMAPLWATSFNAAIRWMGGTWWKRLHRLTYVAAGLACYHYYLQSKADHHIPLDFIYVLGALLLWRAVGAAVHFSRMPATAKPAPAGFPLESPGKVRSWTGELKVVGMFKETPSARTFRLAPPGGRPIPFEFRAGQFLNLSVPIDGKTVRRSYTIASPPTRDGYVELTIKREDNGQVSKYLHDVLMTGQTVSISAPAGRFTFDPNRGGIPAEGVLLIAGGVGVTPLMSIVRDLTDRCWPGTIDLIFSVRSADEVIFADELRYLAARFPNLHVHPTITRDGPAEWTGRRGRITAEWVNQLVPDAADRPVFICGPDEMAHAVKNDLITSGVPAERITLESFTPAATPVVEMPPGDGSAVTTATVTFARSDRTAPLPSNKTVLDAAESVGVPIDYQCRAGICGTCRTKLLAGQVTMAVRDAISDADEADGYILACQARAGEDVTVDA